MIGSMSADGWWNTGERIVCGQMGVNLPFIQWPRRWSPFQSITPANSNIWVDDGPDRGKIRAGTLEQ